MNDKPLENASTDDDRKIARDALHAELPEAEQRISESLRTSVHAEASEPPPMPEELLDEVLSDLGVAQSPSAAKVSQQSQGTIIDMVLAIFRENPVSLGLAAAAACVALLLAVNLDPEKDHSPGDSGLRGGGSNNVLSAAPALVVLFQPSDSLRDEVTANFEEEHLRIAVTDDELKGFLNATDRVRIVVQGNRIARFEVDATEAESEIPLPAAADDAVDAIGVVLQELE